MKGLPLFGICSAGFDYFFLDQFGVLHDGHRPYPGVLDALKRLKARGARVVVLSNSGRSGEYNAQRMQELGIPSGLYDQFLTSGDAAKAALVSGDLPIRPGPTTKCLTMSATGEHQLADDLGFGVAKDGAEADLLIISGSQADRVSLDEYAKQLEPAARRRSLCLCTNPDKLMLKSTATYPGAGAIATLYEQLGGQVNWIGKPYPAIYAAAARLVGSPDPSKVLCVGDSVEHDIVGARRFGAAAALVRTGILADLSEAELALECGKHDVLPDVILAGLAD